MEPLGKHFQRTLTQKQPREKNNIIVHSSFHTMQKRCPEYYKVIKTQTERFRKSAISTIHMIKMLNDCQKKKREPFES